MIRAMIFGIVRGLVIAAVATIGVVGCYAFEDPQPTERPAVTPPTPKPVPSEAAIVDAYMKAYKCSQTGLGEGVIPAHAVIRTVSGDIVVVSLDRGWEVLKGERPGDLIAGCKR